MKPEEKPPLPAKYKDNQDIPLGKLISQERSVGRLNASIKLIDAKVKPWREIELQEFKGEKNDNIAPGRKVWIVKLNYVDKVKFGGGKCKANTQVTKLVDAESGDNLGVEVRCPKGAFESFLPKPKPEQLEILRFPRRRDEATTK